MKKKSGIMILPLVLMCLALMLNNGCKKDSNNDSNDQEQPAQLPVLTTVAATSITTVSAICGGDISTDQGSTVTVRGVCWSTGVSPTISDSKTSDGTGNGYYQSNLAGLSPHTTYYFRAYATSSAGTGYGNILSFTTTGSGGTLAIGQTYQGGVIAYMLQAGDIGYDAVVEHGIIVATTDQNNSFTWYNGSYTTTGATATAIGTGNANTNTIFSSQGAGSYAAQSCYDLVVDIYTDWYLPAKMN